MANGNASEVNYPYVQSAVFFNFGISPNKITACVTLLLDYHTVHKDWLEIDENCGSTCSRFLKMVTSEILQSAPNDPKLTPKKSDRKSTLYMQFIGPQSQFFVLQSAVFKILPILRISN